MRQYEAELALHNWLLMEDEEYRQKYGGELAAGKVSMLYRPSPESWRDGERAETLATIRDAISAGIYDEQRARIAGDVLTREVTP